MDGGIGEGERGSGCACDSGCRWVTVAELARELRVSAQWIYRATRIGLIPLGLKLGKYNRYDRRLVYETLKKKQRRVTQDQ